MAALTSAASPETMDININFSWVTSNKNVSFYLQMLAVFYFKVIPGKGHSDKVMNIDT